MNNSPKKNLEFERQFCITNLRYLLGEPSPFSEETEKRIQFNRDRIEEIEKQLPASVG
jgi:hypothetical protein